MRLRMAIYLVGLGLACQGCAPLWQSARTTLLQPLIYRRGMTDIRECHRNRELAETAWGTYVSQHLATMEYSPDFESGFKEGFADFLFYGGTGAPPPVPPRCYWNFKYETAQGHKAIQNWFAGFRVGAESARASGYRKLVVVPASTCLSSNTPQAAQLPPPSQAPVPGLSPEPRAGSEEMLPPPREVTSPENPSTGTPPPIESLPPPSAPGRPPAEVPPESKEPAATGNPPTRETQAAGDIPSNPMLATSLPVATDGRPPLRSEANAP